MLLKHSRDPNGNEGSTFGPLTFIATTTCSVNTSEIIKATYHLTKNANAGHSLVFNESLKYFLQYQTYLGIYVARVTQQRLNHLRVSFVNSDMQWRAFVFVALVSICASFQQGGGCWRLITKGVKNVQRIQTRITSDPAQVMYHWLPERSEKISNKRK